MKKLLLFILLTGCSQSLAQDAALVRRFDYDKKVSNSKWSHWRRPRSRASRCINRRPRIRRTNKTDWRLVWAAHRGRPSLKSARGGKRGGHGGPPIQAADSVAHFASWLSWYP